MGALSEPIVFTSDDDGVSTFELTMSALVDASSTLTTDYLTISLTNGVAVYF